jgi:hypothetical protein
MSRVMHDGLGGSDVIDGSGNLFAVVAYGWLNVGQRPYAIVAFWWVAG